MRTPILAVVLLVVACGDETTPDMDAALDSQVASDGSGSDGFESDVSEADAASDAETPDGTTDAETPDDASMPEPCVTRVHYDSSWIAPADHPARYDDVAGVVSWDGSCGSDGTNSVAELSNGWRPIFRGNNSCVIALQQRGECPSPPPECSTRITYASTWDHPDGHPNQYDDTSGVVSWSGTCESAGGSRRRATLSNGWVPHFSGACGFSFRYTQCGGLYANPVVPEDCPDPGVARDGDRYVMVCTGGRFKLFTSPDLVTWTREGAALAEIPGWSINSHWAPEIHEVAPGRWITYFSARHRDGDLALGAAVADNALGPYVDIGRPLLRDPNPGVIDTHFFQASTGERYLLWKVDGNAVGRQTPIRIQPIAEDGITLMGSAQTILTNDRSSEGGLVEGQWLVERGGFFYLFYSQNGYATPRYATGVARASSVTGPYTKANSLLVTSGAYWDGPGHGSVLRAPGGDWVYVYHSWPSGRAGDNPPGRNVLLDRIRWQDGWPHMDGAPTGTSLPRP